MLTVVLLAVKEVVVAGEVKVGLAIVLIVIGAVMVVVILVTEAAVVLALKVVAVV